MKIERADLIHLRVPITSPFETSFGRILEFDKLLLKFYTPDFQVYTECSAWPDLGYSYETIGTAMEVLKSHLLKAILGQDLAGPEDFWKHCGRFRGHPMAKASIENGLWIIKALEENKPLAKLLGNEKERVPAGVSIGIQETVEGLVDLVGQNLAQGYSNIKMKIKPGWDIRPVAAVRKVYPEVPLRVDANSAYTLKDIDALKTLDEFNLMAMEQPLAHDDIFDHARLQAQLKTFICLDESIQSPYIARMALEMKACRIINIKQCRVAGLTKAIEIHDLCQKEGVGVWCGGMFETGVGRAILIALTGLPNFIYPTDTSASNRYFHRDIVDPEFTLQSDGTIRVPQGPGLGVEVNEKILEDHILRREVIKI
jgi:O-succinylbenzoate synthase